MLKIGNSRKTKTIVNTAFGLLNRFCNIILSFGLRTAFIHILGLQYTGVSALFTDILTVLSFVELGIGTAIATALYSPLKENDESTIRKLMTFYKIAYRYIAAFVFAAGLLLTPFLDYLVRDVPNIKEDIKIIFLFYILKTAVSYLLIYKATILTADQKQYKVKGWETICTIIRYAVEVVLLVIFKEFILYLIAEVFFTLAQNIVVTRKAEQQYPYAFEKTSEQLSKQEVKSLLKDIKGLAMYKVSGTVGNSVDNILISSLISTTQVGVLSNYTLIRKQVEQMLNQFFQALTPSVGNLVAEKNNEKQYFTFNVVYYLSFLVVNFCSCAMLVLFNPFIEVWLGTNYILGVKISFIIAFDFFLYILLQAIASFRTANGLFVKGQYRPLIMAIMNVVLSIVFIKKWGIFGTILATSICRLLTQWYDPYILFKYAFQKKFRIYYFKYWIYIIIFLSGAFLTYHISMAFDFKSIWIRLIYRIVCCLIVPNVWAVLTTYKSSEFNYCFATVKKKLRKT